MKTNKIYIFLLLILTLSLSSCLKDLRESDFRDENLSSTIDIEVKLPQGYNYSLGGLVVTLTDPSTGLVFQGVTSTNGIASIKVAHGTYIATTNFKETESGGVILIFNGTTDQIRVTPVDAASVSKQLPLTVSKAGQIVIKEFFFGGRVNPVTGKKYSSDQYIILYNNSSEVAYLDSLCVGVVDPWNALINGAQSHWVKPGTTELRDSVPNIGIGWMFPGSGKENALQPGQELVISLNAINHLASVPSSADLSKPGYWALYDAMLTPAQSSPEPGVRSLEGFWKAGLTKSYTISQSSPALFLYTLGGKSPAKFVEDTYTQNPKYANANFNVLMVDKDLVLDGVECFRNPTDTKRFRSEIDNGYVMIAAAGEGQSVHRKIDEQATAATGGRIVYMDTNDSSKDFEVRDIASLLKK